MAFFTYILELENGSYYVGHTSDLKRRIKEHQEGRACSHTRKYPIVRLCWYEKQPDRFTAAKREKEIKGWRREKKEKLWLDVGSS
ncbi:MAG: GIY-YIG nuclease family protein [Candidatus Peribacteraceae bacterium]|jgi:predicted GIY-YIG superfamily endonuclease